MTVTGALSRGGNFADTRDAELGGGALITGVLRGVSLRILPEYPVRRTLPDLDRGACRPSRSDPESQVTGSSSSATASRVPPHLRHLIVRQDYSRYSAIDQAVWRFVLLQTHARLKSTAHPAYCDGLGQTGISVERIPRIAEMDEKLAPFGWGAVCVDGFIPPRAFQELQSLSILPIAADMRTAEHLVYTPAPDIIHEAAGHAPILPDATYASYLRRVGAAGARAFTLPADTRVDRAVHALSEVKEEADAMPERIAAAERELVEARRAQTRLSEAARLSRLYWWTAEYGLVGTPKDYRLYGAGLLSSLWESFACHDPQVEKLPLTAAVTEVDYDVTRPQPRLFVTASFEKLHDVLDDVTAGLASVRGGEGAVLEALAAEEVGTFELAFGARLTGQLTKRRELEGASHWLTFEGRARAQLNGERFDTAALHAVLCDADSLALTRSDEQRQLELVLESGLRVRGRLMRAPVSSGAASLLVFASGTLETAGERAVLAEGAVVALSPRVLGAHAGADSDFYPVTELPDTSIPRPRTPAASERALLELYERALSALRSELGSAIVPVFEALHRELKRLDPEDWLLRWNLLESLLKLGAETPLIETLRDELWELELSHRRQQPIASGLRYLADRAGLELKSSMVQSSRAASSA
jgi:phenylalanine-4-hydroxylase